MGKFVCPVCGYIHDDATGEPFSDLPETWTCPICGAAKSFFETVPDAVEANSGTESTSPVPGSTNRALVAHRVFGYFFLGVYLILIVQMVSRLWTYQIEFPARTVVHISLGMAVGVMLLLKIGIVRFFRKLEQALVPFLGTSLLVSSVVLIGISVPWAFREAYATSRLFTPASQSRVRTLLAQAGLDETQCKRYSNASSLREGQQILRRECIECHDLRTVLVRPRTPSLWRQTVRRMAGRTIMLDPLDDEQQLQVTAYLTALSPQLQKSTGQLTEQQEVRAQSRETVETMMARESTSELAAYDSEEAQALVAAKCSQCHETALIAETPPGSDAEARELVARMVEEGMDASESELSLMIEYLKRTYVK